MRPLRLLPSRLTSCFALAATLAALSPAPSWAAGRGGGGAVFGVRSGAGIGAATVRRGGSLVYAGRRYPGRIGTGFGRGSPGRDCAFTVGTGCGGIGGGTGYGTESRRGFGQPGFGRGRYGRNGYSAFRYGLGYAGYGWPYGGYGFGYGSGGAGPVVGGAFQAGGPVAIGIPAPPVQPPAIYVIGRSAHGSVRARSRRARSGEARSGAVRVWGGQVSADSRDAGQESGVVGGRSSPPGPRFIRLSRGS